jgi:2-polyprenyl-3-methyl-5-hydroxy-6-metoxy-1,4-benzoquinol methylase
LPGPQIKALSDKCSDTETNSCEWANLHSDAAVSATCPNCGVQADQSVILTTSWPRAGGGQTQADLLRCRSCGCGFFHDVPTADYEQMQTGGEGALAFYLQQGAGLWGIASNLADLGRPAETSLLEIGCGFGFGLDFARRALGWQVRGLDPSPLAAAGRTLLGLPIESRYLTLNDPELSGRFDVVMASEVIEHVPSPLAFAQTLRSALRDGGTLVLTTPDVDAARPNTPPGLLVPLLSVGFHLVLQSQQSLAWLLKQAGFTEVEVRRTGGASLIARARNGGAAEFWPFAPDRGVYRRYLTDAADAVEAVGDLWFGLTARAYREAVNAVDQQAADQLWQKFSTACRQRFGHDPEAAPDHAAMALEALARHEPLCLGPVLLHRGFHLLQSGQGRIVAEPVFLRAAAACNRLRHALQRIGTDDGDAEDIAWVAEAEALLCAAERGAADTPARFVAIGTAPADSASAGVTGRTASFTRRIYVSLVNAGSYAAADELAACVAAVRALPPATIHGDDALDVLFCAGVRELQRDPPDPAAGLALLRELQAASAVARAAGRAGSATGLVQPAREAEILALKMLGEPAAADPGGGR